MSSTAANEQGTRAEQHVADAVDGERTPDAWFDVEADGIHEVKSTRAMLAAGRRGRFRLWLQQHQNLRDHNGRYHFLLIDGDRYDELVDGAEDVDDDEEPEPIDISDAIIAVREMDPEDVDDAIEDADLKWSTSGNHAQDYRQAKINWRYIFPDVAEDR